MNISAISWILQLLKVIELLDSLKRWRHKSILIYLYPFLSIFSPYFVNFICGTLKMALISEFLSYLCLFLSIFSPFLLVSFAALKMALISEFLSYLCPFLSIFSPYFTSFICALKMALISEFLTYLCPLFIRAFLVYYIRHERE